MIDSVFRTSVSPLPAATGRARWQDGAGTTTSQDQPAGARTMDITTIGTVSEDEGIVVHLKDAAGELLFDGEGETATPVTARVAGTYSSFYRKAQKKVKDRNVRAMRRGEDYDGDTLDEGQFELEAACIREWSLTANGQPFPITVANWRALVAKQPQWQEQVQQAMGRHAAFFKAS